MINNGDILRKAHVRDLCGSKDECVVLVTAIPFNGPSFSRIQLQPNIWHYAGDTGGLREARSLGKECTAIETR